MNYIKIGFPIVFLTLISCADAPDADKANASAAEEVTMTSGSTYSVKEDQSKLTWIGTKATGRHEGTIMLKTGTLVVDNGQLTGGDFIIDLTTIKPHDQDEEGNTKLQGHLKSEDFFDVKNHPEGKFEITDVQPIANPESADVKLNNATHNITGNLSLKGTTKSITFPANVDMDGNKITAKADFNIDRGQWNINYRNDKSLGNKYIHPEVNIKLDMVAVK